MSILESIVSAVSSVFSNKMRSILTMLGIIIGIASVIMITSIGEGVKSSTTSMISELGFEYIGVSVDHGGDITYDDQLKMDDIKTLKNSSNVSYVAPISYLNGTYKLKNPRDTKKVNVTGTTAEYKYAQPVEILYGRFLADIDVENESNAVIIDSVMAKNIFGQENVVGQKITISFYGFPMDLEIVGVSKGLDYGALYDFPASAYMPITTVMNIFNNDIVDQMSVSVRDKDKADQTIEEMSQLLNANHGTTGKYRFQNMMAQMDSMNEIMGQLTLFVTFVAGISLLVGGIGVMNIMLVTVTERTREIGIRKSLGATDHNIQFQFLVESMVLTMIGGIIGIMLGYLGSVLVGSYMDLVPILSPISIAVTVTVSSLIGIVFGVYPASKAAKLDPIEALRYE